MFGGEVWEVAGAILGYVQIGLGRLSGVKLPIDEAATKKYTSMFEKNEHVVFCCVCVCVCL